jgi:hypothetical protein
MHQHIRERRNRYFYQLAQLRQLAEVTQIEPAVLAAHLQRMRAANEIKEVLSAPPFQSGDTTP